MQILKYDGGFGGCYVTVLTIVGSEWETDGFNVINPFKKR